MKRVLWFVSAVALSAACTADNTDSPSRHNVASSIQRSNTPATPLTEVATGSVELASGPLDWVLTQHVNLDGELCWGYKFPDSPLKQGVESCGKTLDSVPLVVEVDLDDGSRQRFLCQLLETDAASVIIYGDGRTQETIPVRSNQAYIGATAVQPFVIAISASVTRERVVDANDAVLAEHMLQ